MSELQATLELQVELSKFYNVDLFQRGYYQVRTALKHAPKAPVKVELNLPRNNDCNLVFPASVMNGVAVSKTFQILYRNEDVSVDDVILFKIQMLVDSLRVEECVQAADLQLCVELWFTEEEVGPEYQDKLQCISQRTLKLNLDPNQGLHHHVPVLFDYFHLSVICVSVHATLLSLHQPYISIPGRVTKTAWSKEQSPLESIYFQASNRPTTPGFSNLDIKLREACAIHKNICQMLLSAYESLQNSFLTIVARLPPYCKKIRIEQKDCHRQLDLILEVMQNIESEDEFLTTAQSDVAQLCAENVIMWSQYLELVTLHEKVTHQLAKEHHIQRVKRFAEAFFTEEHPKREAIACYDNTTHSHVDLANMVRNSRYFQNIPPLDVECNEMDGDNVSFPIVFEDVFCDAKPIKQFSSSPDDEIKLRNKKRDSRSDNSSEFSSDSSPKFKRGSKLNFIKNVKPESIHRPSLTGGGQSRQISTNVAGMHKSNATLVGYKKVNTDNENLPVVELGTLSPAPNFTQNHFSKIAASMPSLLGQTHAQLMNSGSLPDLNRSLSLKESVLKKSAEKEDDTISETGLDAVRRRLTLPSEMMTPTKDGGTDTKSEDAKTGIDTLSLSPSDSSTGDIQNGFVPSSSVSETGENEKSPDADEKNQNGSSMSENNEQTLDGKELQANSLRDALSNAESTSDTLRPESVALSDKTNNSSTVSGLVSLQDVDIGSKQSVEQTRGSETETSTSTLDYSTNSSQTTVNPSESSPSATNSDHPPLAQNISSASVQSDSSDYMRSECTIMELLKEEYNNSQKDSGSESGTPKGQRKGGVGMRAGFGSKPGRAVNLTKTTSSPDFVNHRNGTVAKPRQSLVSPVQDATINFIAAKENFRRNIFYTGCIYSDFPTQCSSIPYFWPPDTHHRHSDDESAGTSSDETQQDGLHLVVCVHGLDGNSADLRLVRTYLEMSLPGGRIDFLMSERNQPDTFADFEVMTDKLVEEILYHIEIYGIDPARISFVGHSLGNLIIRSALSRQGMAPLLKKLYTFLSLSGPHLGTLYNSSGLVNMGMWFMQKWKKSGSLLQLSLKDASDPRETFLYKLSMKSGMEYFKYVLLVSSTQDRYVPYHSSRIELCKSAVKDNSGMGGVYAEMVNNILQPIIMQPNTTLIRYDVFHALNNTANSIIGRAAHIAVLDSELFIEKFMTVAGLKYFK